MRESIHGGDIYRNSVKLDFSVNINPLGIPEQVKQALLGAVSDCSHYPDERAENLRAAIAKQYQTKESEIVCGNGASELFLALVHAIRPRKVLIPIPSFFGYERAAGAVDCEICYFEMKKEHRFCLSEEVLDALTEDIDLLFLANPNNPIGNLLPKELMEKILIRCREKSIYVVVDECFLEFCEKEASHSLLNRREEFENLLIVRAFTKSFAIPGVRLGFLISGNLPLLKQIQNQLPEWNLSVFAQAAGVAAVSEMEYQQKSRGLIKTEREFLTGRLRQEEIEVYPGEANFLFCHTQIPLYEKLLKREILIRDCSNFNGLKAGYYRIAVKTRGENEMLLAAIFEINRERERTDGKH